MLNTKTIEQTHFNAAMEHVAAKINLHRDGYLGIAGAGGAKKVKDELMAIWTQTGVHIAVAISGLGQSSTSNLD
jgi:hypothetical protein